MVKKDFIPFLIILSSFILALYASPILPNPLPIHWTYKGEVNGWAPKDLVILFGHGIVFLFLFLLMLAPYYDPLEKNYHDFADAMYGLRFTLVIFLLVFVDFVIFSNLIDFYLRPSIIIGLNFSFLYGAFAYYFPLLKRNYFFGIRTPYTLESNSVWRKTHKAAGVVFMFASLFNFLTIFIQSGTLLLTILILFASLTILYWYSYFIWKAEK